MKLEPAGLGEMIDLVARARKVQDEPDTSL